MERKLDLISEVLHSQAFDKINEVYTLMLICPYFLRKS